MKTTMKEWIEQTIEEHVSLEWEKYEDSYIGHVGGICAAAEAIAEELFKGLVYEENGVIMNTNSPWGTSVRSDFYPDGSQIAWLSARFARDGEPVTVTVAKREATDETL